jgi:hypothetical protein
MSLGKSTLLNAILGREMFVAKASVSVSPISTCPWSPHPSNTPPDGNAVLFCMMHEAQSTIHLTFVQRFFFTDCALFCVLSSHLIHQELEEQQIMDTNTIALMARWGLLLYQ